MNFVDFSSILLQIATVGFATAAVLLCLAIFAPANFLANTLRDNSSGQPVRQLGGLAILPVAMVAVWFFSDSVTLQSLHFQTVAGVVAMWSLGLIDDHYHLPAGPKLAVQLLAASGAAIAVAPGISLGVLPAFLETLAAAVILVGFANMTNFMDGMDLMSVVGIGVPLAALSALLLAHGESGVEIMFGLLLFGALIGFAPFNWPPARLYLGDSGSLAIGLAAGLLALRAAQLDLAAAFLPFGYYLADTVTTFLLRARAGENLLQAHSRHAYQAALKAGRRPVWVAVRVLATNLVLSGLAALALFSANPVVDVGAILSGIAICLVVLWRFRRAA